MSEPPIKPNREWPNPENPVLEAPRKPPHNGSCFKTLLIWVSPSLVVPLLFVSCGGAWPFGTILAIGFLVWMGTISSGDSSGKRGDDAATSKGRVALYVVLQLIWIPLFLAAALWGVCVFSGSGHF